MPVRVEFVGEPAWAHPHVAEILHHAFDPVPGDHEIAVVFHAGRGYSVLAASSEEPGAGPLRRVDIRPAVASLLRRNRIAVEE
jgi:hypothetical protein